MCFVTYAEIIQIHAFEVFSEICRISKTTMNTYKKENDVKVEIRDIYIIRLIPTAYNIYPAYPRFAYFSPCVDKGELPPILP